MRRIGLGTRTTRDFRLELRDECGHKGSTRRNRTLTSTGICTGISDASVLCRSPRPHLGVMLGIHPVMEKILLNHLTEASKQCKQPT